MMKFASLALLLASASAFTVRVRQSHPSSPVAHVFAPAGSAPPRGTLAGTVETIPTARAARCTLHVGARRPMRARIRVLTQDLGPPLQLLTPARFLPLPRALPIPLDVVAPRSVRCPGDRRRRALRAAARSR